jgi:hypothetical protein
MVRFMCVLFPDGRKRAVSSRNKGRKDSKMEL